MEKREIEFTTRLTREDVAGLIEALIEGLKDGKLKIKKSSEILELEVPRVVDLEVEASIDEERAEFEIEVSWRTNRAENPDLPLDEEKKEAALTEESNTGTPVDKKAKGAAKGSGSRAKPKSSARGKTSAAQKGSSGRKPKATDQGESKPKSSTPNKKSTTE